MNGRRPPRKRRRSGKPPQGKGGVQGAARPASQGESAQKEQPSTLEIGLEKAERELLARRAHSRGELYGILSLLFQESPSTDLLALYRHTAFVAIIKQLFPPEILEKWEKFSSSKMPLEHLQARLRMEYHNLFMLPSSQRVVIRESEYHFDPANPKGHHQRANEVQKFYRRIGMTPISKFKDQPDHLSQILHFMSILCDREGDYLEKNNPGQLQGTCQIECDFVSRHLANWIPQMTQRLNHSTRFPFYRNIAELLERFIDLEGQWTSGMLERYKLKPKRSTSPQRPFKPRPEQPAAGGAAPRNVSPPKGESRSPEDKKTPRRRRRPRHKRPEIKNRHSSGTLKQQAPA